MTPRSPAATGTRFALAAVVVAVLTTLLSPGARGPAPAPALSPVADVRQFQAGNIISDDLFFAGNAMSAGDVQAFLDAKGVKCVAGEQPCLKDYRVLTVDLPADNYCAGYRGAPGESAAAVIAQAGASCGISQRALLVVMQKEMGLVRNTGSTVLTTYRYDRAMGFKCPDGRPCDPLYAGLQRQVYYAARQYKVYAANPTSYNFRPGVTSNVRFDVETTCGSAPVHIANQATAGLYNYTPYQPNQAALDAGYGSAEPCGAYGNRNFWLYYTDWFGSTRSPGGDAVVTRAKAASATLGPATSSVICGLAGGGCFQAFRGGSIYWSPATGAQIVRGAIGGHWATLGWERSFLGYPVGEEVCGLVDGGCFQAFQHGSVHFTPGVGAHATHGAIRIRWAAQHWEQGPLGYPTGDEVCGLPAGGCFQTFEGGSIYWSPATGARIVSGLVHGRWAAQGWEKGALGYPTGDTTCGLRDTGCFQTFQGGSIYSSATGGARIVGGAVRDKWAAQRWETGPLGYPTMDTVCALRDGGCFQTFENGSIYWSAATGARIVSVAVRSAWAAQGWEQGALGYPISDTVCRLTGDGCYQSFQGGAIVLSSAGGTRTLTPAIRDRWVAAGREQVLGYPTQDTICGLARGGCFQDFQHGSVYTSPAGGARVVRGEIKARWGSQSWESGRLGYPVSDQVCGLTGDGCFQRFEGGAIYSTRATGAHAVWGAIAATWAGQSWERGRLGYPTGEEVCGLTSGGCSQTFQGGVVYWSPATGARPVVGAILGPWSAAGAERGALGYPIRAEVCTLVRGGCFQTFQGGSVHWSPATGAHPVRGGILTAWGNAGWENGTLGYPTAAPVTSATEITQRFEGGTLAQNLSTGRVTRR